MAEKIPTSEQSLSHEKASVDFLRLPIDIRLLVLERFIRKPLPQEEVGHAECTSLKNISMVCKHLRQLAAPLLFRNLQISNSFLLDRLDEVETKPSLPQRCLDHARSITFHLQVPSGANSDSNHNLEPRHLLEVTFAYFADILRQLRPISLQFDRFAFEFDCEVEFETLGFNDQFLKMVEGFRPCDLTTLSLRTVRLGDEDVQPVGSILRTLYDSGILPRITYLSVDMSATQGVDIEFITSVALFSHLRRLDVITQYLAVMNTHDIVFPSLEHLVLQEFDPSRYTEDGSEFKELLGLFKACQQTLKTFDSSIWIDYSTPQCPGLSLSSLEVLHIGASVSFFLHQELLGFLSFYGSSPIHTFSLTLGPWISFSDTCPTLYERDEEACDDAECLNLFFHFLEQQRQGGRWKHLKTMTISEPVEKGVRLPQWMDKLRDEGVEVRWFTGETERVYVDML
ncbi:hypothetical protein BT69DRAFT_361981 [Atractiella rhizophila]|nr:hypothetical protein BT69DRAFT_361981 [Atractiella rhizophila]